MKKYKKFLITLVSVVIVVMSFAVTAFAATYSISWSCTQGQFRYGVNRYTMTSKSKISHEAFTRTDEDGVGYQLRIGVYCHDDGNYYMRKNSNFGTIDAGSFYGVNGLCSFAVVNGGPKTATISGTYTY